MKTFPCPYLGGDIELSDEREQHIIATHPDLLPYYWTELVETLNEPDQVRRSTRMPDALLIARWFKTIRGGKYIVAVVVTEQSPSRNWMITAYLARKLTGGILEWQKT
ncbi:MAG: hypothetical protein D6742_16685 [Cyanobacteria bacterium J069]|nr:MAG: hypothetical protein D6742_16685 [Cyanobacteria bacterium J069]